MGRRLPRLPRPDLAGEAPGSSDRDRTARAPPAADRGQGRSRGSTTSASASSPSSPRPVLARSRVLGEIGEREKGRFLGDARTLLFPIDWPEPFGLVMIEVTACGTPVVAYRCGSVPEVIEEGVTGFVVDDLEGAVEAVRRTRDLDRRRCRETFERRFDAERMARDYVAIYERLIASSQPSRRAA